METAFTKTKHARDGYPEAHEDCDEDGKHLEDNAKRIVDLCSSGGRCADCHLEEALEVGRETSIRHKVEHVDDEEPQHGWVL